MKTAATISTPMFYHQTLPVTSIWGSTSQRIRRRPRPALSVVLTDDEVAAKQEMICGGILGLCFFYTIIQCLVTLA